MVFIVLCGDVFVNVFPDVGDVKSIQLFNLMLY